MQVKLVMIDNDYGPKLPNITISFATYRQAVTFISKITGYSKSDIQNELKDTRSFDAEEFTFKVLK